MSLVIDWQHCKLLTTLVFIYGCLEIICKVTRLSRFPGYLYWWENMLKLIMNLIMKRDWIRINHIAAKTALTRNQNKKSIQRILLKRWLKATTWSRNKNPKETYTISLSLRKLLRVIKLEINIFKSRHSLPREYIISQTLLPSLIG